MSLNLSSPYPQAGIGRALAQRWCSLAESRLEYLTELFESGRWRRFYGEVEFLENIQEAKDTVDRWRTMVADETAAMRSALSGRVIYQAPRAIPQRAAAPRALTPRAAPSLAVTALAPEPLLEVVAAPAMAPSEPDVVAVAADAGPELIPIETLLRRAPPRVAAVGPTDLDWQNALDPMVIGERYPMLRTAM